MSARRARPAAALVVAVLAASLLPAPVSGAGRRTEHVVLVTIDGLRPQELFQGIDPVILDAGERAGVEDPEPLRARFWRETAAERRRALMPFFWDELAPSGVVLESSIGNPHRNSYPGYSEILTGRVLPEVEGNIELQIPAETVLEIVRRELGLGATQVAAFTSWSHFPYIVESRPGSIFVNAGFEDVPRGLTSLEMERLNELQGRLTTPWETVRYNAITLGLAHEYLALHWPRLLFVALDETDEWAHARRYDRTIEAIHQCDRALAKLWSRLQELEPYRGRTTLVVTTDHGRGVTPEDWTDHGSDIDTARDTWVAILGPDTPARGVVASPARNDQVAATILALLGLDPDLLGPGAGRPIESAFP